MFSKTTRLSDGRTVKIPVDLIQRSVRYTYHEIIGMKFYLAAFDVNEKKWKGLVLVLGFGYKYVSEWKANWPQEYKGDRE